MELGLTTGKKVMLALLILGVMAFAILVVLQSITDTTIAATSGSGTNVNETLTTVTETGENFTVVDLEDVSCGTVTNVINTTSSPINSGNYTQTNCNLLFRGATVVFNNTDWIVTYDFTYNRIGSINANITGGVETFFSNAGTWFALLAIVILIMIIVLVMKSVSSIDKGSKGGSL